MSLSVEQRTFADAEGKIVLCACPGSGKTYTVAHKLSMYLAAWTEQHKGVATLSFTNIASQEIQHKVKELSVNGVSATYPHLIATIDSFLNQYIFLRYAYLLTEQEKKPHLSQTNIEFPFRWWRSECRRNGCTKAIQEFRWSIDDKTYRNNELVQCAGGRYGPPCDQYKNMLIRKGIFFQNDVPYISYLILEKYPQIAKALAERFPIILLDEAQDTSKEQMAILDLLANAGVKTFCIVGDPDQAIYEWRNASASCFINKINDDNWNTLFLSENRRSSQAICNATKYFSKMNECKAPNIAVGGDKDFGQKPELILINGNTDIESIHGYFLQRCSELGIERTKDNIAILTRGRIHKETDITGLWKSDEVELLAKASYCWQYSSKRESYNLCSKCLYLMFIGSPHESKHDILFEIESKISYEIWKRMCYQLLCNLPSADLSISIWIEKMKEVLNQLDTTLDFVDGHSIKDVIKIKLRDKNNPDFKSIPIKCFFEKKNQDTITISSIHGVKGQTFEATLLYAPSTTGATITRAGLTNGDLDNEHIRAAYVAMTRPKKYLAVVLQKPSKNSDLPLNRFPLELWNYKEL